MLKSDCALNFLNRLFTHFDQIGAAFVSSLLNLSFFFHLDALELGCKLAEHELSDFQLKIKSSGMARSFNMIDEG